jgi:hypothetical protein
MVVTKAGYAHQEGRTRKPFLSQKVQQAAEKGAITVHGRLAQDDAEKYLLAFDSAHGVPPEDHDSRE